MGRLLVGGIQPEGADQGCTPAVPAWEPQSLPAPSSPRRQDPPPRAGCGIDLERVRQERHQFDVGGHYARPDAFILKDNIRAQGLVNFQP